MRHRIASADSRLGRKSPACCHRGSRGLPGLQAFWLPAPGGVFQISSFFLVRPGFGVEGIRQDIAKSVGLFLGLNQSYLPLVLKRRLSAFRVFESKEENRGLGQSPQEQAGLSTSQSRGTLTLEPPPVGSARNGPTVGARITDGCDSHHRNTISY